MIEKDGWSTRKPEANWHTSIVVVVGLAAGNHNVGVKNGSCMELQWGRGSTAVLIMGDHGLYYRPSIYCPNCDGKDRSTMVELKQHRCPNQSLHSALAMSSVKASLSRTDNHKEN